jgi:hypothetical protein
VLDYTSPNEVGGVGKVGSSGLSTGFSSITPDRDNISSPIP